MAHAKMFGATPIPFRSLYLLLHTPVHLDVGTVWLGTWRGGEGYKYFCTKVEGDMPLI